MFSRHTAYVIPSRKSTRLKMGGSEDMSPNRSRLFSTQGGTKASLTRWWRGTSGCECPEVRFLDRKGRPDFGWELETSALVSQMFVSLGSSSVQGVGPVLPARAADPGRFRERE